VVKFSFQEIGEADPFHPSQPSREILGSLAPLYTAPVLSTVNAVSKTDIASTSAGNVPPALTLTQEQFNAYMSTYEGTMGRMARLPASSPGYQASNRRTNPRVTCFNCGNRGHYSDTCMNQPLTTYEEQEIGERIRKERELNHAVYRHSEPIQPPPLSGSNAIAITQRSIMPRPNHEPPKLSTVGAVPVSCLRSCSVSQGDLGIACVVAARIAAVRTIFENALAEKRARVEDTESEVHNTQRATKVTRRAGELGESLGLRRSLRPTNNPLAKRRGLEHTTVEDGDSEMEEAEQDIIHESIRFADGFDKIDRMAPERVEPERAPPRKLRKRALIAPINWMKDQSPFTIRDALTGSASQLQITLPQLLDCSPMLRRDLAELLRSSVPCSRKKRLSSGKAQAEPITLHSAKEQVGRNILSEANPELQENIECLYIEAWVGKNKLPEVLVDAGAMLDLISTQLIDKLGFERFPVSGLGMRLAMTDW